MRSLSFIIHLIQLTSLMILPCVQFLYVKIQTAICNICLNIQFYQFSILMKVLFILCNKNVLGATLIENECNLMFNSQSNTSMKNSMRARNNSQKIFIALDQSQEWLTTHTTSLFNIYIYQCSDPGYITKNLLYLAQVLC